MEDKADISYVDTAINDNLRFSPKEGYTKMSWKNNKILTSKTPSSLSVYYSRKNREDLYINAKHISYLSNSSNISLFLGLNNDGSSIVIGSKGGVGGYKYSNDYGVTFTDVTFSNFNPNYSNYYLWKDLLIAYNIGSTTYQSSDVQGNFLIYKKNGSVFNTVSITPTLSVQYLGCVCLIPYENTLKFIYAGKSVYTGSITIYYGSLSYDAIYNSTGTISLSLNAYMTLSGTSDSLSGNYILGGDYANVYITQSSTQYILVFQATSNSVSKYSINSTHYSAFAVDREQNCYIDVKGNYRYPTSTVPTKVTNHEWLQANSDILNVMVYSSSSIIKYPNDNITIGALSPFQLIDRHVISRNYFFFRVDEIYSSTYFTNVFMLSSHFQPEGPIPNSYLKD